MDGTYLLTSRYASVADGPFKVYSGKQPFQMYSQAYQIAQEIGQYGHRNLEQVASMPDGLWVLLEAIMSQTVPPEEWPSLANIISELK